jgi:hypothetical protein
MARLREELGQAPRVSRTYTVRQAVDDWLADGLPGRSERTRNAYLEALMPLLAQIGHRPLRELTAVDVKNGLKALSSKCSTRYLQISRNSLERSIRFAQVHQRVGYNVAELIETPRESWAGHRSPLRWLRPRRCSMPLAFLLVEFRCSRQLLGHRCHSDNPVRYRRQLRGLTRSRWKGYRPPTSIGASLARWAAVNLHAAEMAPKNSPTGPPSSPSSMGSASRKCARAADGSMDGSLDGSGATAAPRGRVSCTLVETALNAGWAPRDLAAFTGGNAGGVRNPYAVLAARLSSAELPAPLVRPARPPWCGACDERTRLLGFDGDAPRTCPRCRPGRCR